MLLTACTVVIVHAIYTHKSIDVYNMIYYYNIILIRSRVHNLCSSRTRLGQMLFDSITRGRGTRCSDRCCMDIWPDCLRNVFCDYTVAIVVLISHSINGHLRAYEAVQGLYGYHHVSLSQTRRAIV